MNVVSAEHLGRSGKNEKGGQLRCRKWFQGKAEDVLMLGSLNFDFRLLDIDPNQQIGFLNLVSTFHPRCNSQNVAE